MRCRLPQWAFAFLGVLLSGAFSISGEAREFRLDADEFPDEIASVLLAQSLATRPGDLIQPPSRPCPSDPTAAERVCSPARMRVRQATETRKLAEYSDEVTRGLREQFRQARQIEDIATPETLACRAAAQRIEQRTQPLAQLTDDLSAGRVSRENIAGRWLQILGSGASWESELPTSELQRICSETKSTFYPPIVTLSAAVLRRPFYSRTGDAQRRQICGFEPHEGASIPTAEVPRVRQRLTQAVLDAIQEAPSDLDLASSMTMADWFSLDNHATKEAPSVLPRACGQSPLPPAQRAGCGCAFRQYRDQREALFNQAASRQLQQMADEVSTHLRDQLAASSLSPGLRAALSESLGPGKIRIESLSSDMTYFQALCGDAERRMKVSPAFAAMVGTPGWEGELRATMAHEMGHDIEFLLGRSQLMCQAPIREASRAGCEAAARVQAAMTPEDLQQLTQLRNCLDRNFLYGEWADVRTRFHDLNPIPPQNTFQSKRAEYFGDTFMRMELARLSDSEREEATTLFCASPDDERTLYDGHPTTHYRIEHAISRHSSTGAAGESQTPPYACEQALRTGPAH